MSHSKLRTSVRVAGALAWITLGFAASGCVAKPAFRCQSDASCVSADGSVGTCEANGECSFPSGLGEPGGGSGADAGGGSATAGAAGAPDESNLGGAGHGGSAAQAGTGGNAEGGDAGAPCTDTANDCYACHPTTSTQILNACTASLCVPFDDSKRIKNLPTNGQLPPLPPATGL